MSGFPTRPTRNGFGPSLQDEYPLVDPTKEVGASALNLAFWQLAGVGLTAPLALLHCTVNGGSVAVAQQALAFDPLLTLPLLAVTYSSVGVYSLSFPSSEYADSIGALRTLTLFGGAVFPTSVSGSGRQALGQWVKTGPRSGQVILTEFGFAPADPPTTADNDFTLILW